MPTEPRRPPPRRARAAPLALNGALWLSRGGVPIGGDDRMQLLRAVARTGSLTRAAREVGLSYKGAWDAIEAMNAAARWPLVQRRTGGRGGGATQLTPHGARLLERFEALQAVHRRFVQLLEQGSIDLERDFSLLDVVNMKTSARNQFVGEVTAMRAGAVNDEVELTLRGGTRLVAQVTRQSTASLGLRTGLTAIALIKSSAVMLCTGLAGARLSARNQLAGTVVAVTPGAVNTEVAVALAGGDGQLVAIVDQRSVHGLTLATGTPVTAVFDASNVILAVVD